MKKILVSGIKPTGTLHIANYFGAMRQNIDLGNRDDHESYIFIADYHALTSVKNGQLLRKQIFDLACAYLALGLDCKKVTFFKQSDIPEHTELCVILNNVVTMPYLMRAHAFKDHEAKNKEVNVGLFDYPVLMAADILMYRADIVPVGQDQKQHVEYARDIVGFFNRAWDTSLFKEPAELIIEDVAIVPGIDGRKMSKSYNNIVPLFGTDEEIRKSVMSIVTDSARPEDKKNPDENNIYNIHKLFLNKEEDEILRKKFEDGGYGYRDAKEACALTIINFIFPKREKYDYYQTHPEEVLAVLEDGKRKAGDKAKFTMSEVKKLVGLI